MTAATGTKLVEGCAWCGQQGPVNSVGACMECHGRAMRAAQPKKEPVTFGDWITMGVLIMTAGSVVGLVVFFAYDFLWR